MGLTHARSLVPAAFAAALCGIAAAQNASTASRDSAEGTPAVRGDRPDPRQIE
jgi:hypothetical protein